MNRPDRTLPRYAAVLAAAVLALCLAASTLAQAPAADSPQAQNAKPGPEPAKPASPASPAEQAATSQPATPATPASETKPAAKPARLEEAESLAKRGDLTSALTLFLTLADEGNAQAQLRAGLMLDEGLGAPKDCVKAGDLLKKAADQNLARAQNAMGDRFRFGRCAAKSYKEAMRWYLKAAYQNYAPAMRNLSSMYDNYSIGGRGGKVVAYFWAVLAAKSDPTAADQRDRIMANLAPFQIENVQAMASQWAPGKEFDALEDLQQKKTGTGFVVGKKGFVLTNAHVVKGFKFLKGEMAGREYRLTLAKIDEAADLALLKMDAETPGALRLSGGPLPKPGDPVVAIGFPLRGLLGSDPAVTTGSISSLTGPKNDKRLLQFTAPVQPGNSGGPLLDQSGNVIGVVALKLNALAVADVTGDIPQNVNFALNLDQVRPFLESGGAGAENAQSIARLSPSDIFEKSRGLVMCITASNDESQLKPKGGPKPRDVMPEGG